MTDNIDAILIDDDDIVRATWELSARTHHKSIRLFAKPADFFAMASELSKDVPIYIDYDLGEAITGVDIGKQLYQQGFHRLYICTGYSPEVVGNHAWLKGVQGKSPPWH